MRIKATIVAYVFSVQYFKNATIVAYVGLRVKELTHERLVKSYLFQSITHPSTLFISGKMILDDILCKHFSE